MVAKLTANLTQLTRRLIRDGDDLVMFDADDPDRLWIEAHGARMTVGKIATSSKYFAVTYEYLDKHGEALARVKVAEIPVGAYAELVNNEGLRVSIKFAVDMDSI